MNSGLKQFTAFSSLLLILLTGLALSGCAAKFVADYDSATLEEILRLGKKVDKFYGEMLETPPAERGYAKYSQQYVDVEVDLRSLYVRNKARALNEESTRISEIILNFWIKYKDEHQQTDGYGDGKAQLDRERFTRLFIAAADAETAKKLDAADQNPKAAN